MTIKTAGELHSKLAELSRIISDNFDTITREMEPEHWQEWERVGVQAIKERTLLALDTIELKCVRFLTKDKEIKDLQNVSKKRDLEKGGLGEAPSIARRAKVFC